VTLSQAFADAYGLTSDATSADTAIRFCGSYGGHGFKVAVVLMGGYDATPIDLHLRMSLSGIGQSGDRFRVSRAHWLSQQQVNFGRPELDQDYVVASSAGQDYRVLLATPAVCEGLLKLHPNELILEQQELVLSKWVKEDQLEELPNYASFLVQIGKQIDGPEVNGKTEAGQSGPPPVK
jgi:hypothetical protein